jgi:hypothetical protein
MYCDGLTHSPACQRAHRVTAGCPVDCLASLLPSRILGRLARAHGRRGQPVASCGAPATVGDLARLYRAGRLGEIAGLGPASIRDVGACLAAHGLVDAGDGDAIVAGCPVDCLGAFISGRVLNRLARADGRGKAVAPGGPPATVGEVVRRYREGRLGEIAGLGVRSISEIEAGLVLAGLVLDISTPAPQPRHPCRAIEPARATTARRARRSAVPGGRDRRPGPGGG